MEKEKIIKCPKCKVSMEKESNGKYVIDICPSCGGVFLDAHEINHINKQGFFRYLLNWFRR